MHLWSWGHAYLGQPALEKHVVFIFWNTFHVCRGNLKAHFTIRLDCIGPYANTPTPASECGPREVQLGKSRKQSLSTGNNPALAVPEKQRVGCRGPVFFSDNWVHFLLRACEHCCVSITHGARCWTEGSSLVLVTPKLMRASWPKLPKSFRGFWPGTLPSRCGNPRGQMYFSTSSIFRLLVFSASSDCWSHSKQNKGHTIIQDLW